MSTRRKLAPVERRVIETWMTISEQNGRDLACEVMEKLNRISKEYDIEFESEFKDWAMRSISETQLTLMVENAPFVQTTSDLIQRSGIEWMSHASGLARRG